MVRVRHLLHPRKAWGYPTLPSGTRIGRVVRFGSGRLVDPWTAYWDDGLQVVGCTFTDSGQPCGSFDGGPLPAGDGRRRAVPWSLVPAAVRRGILAQAKAWDASAEYVPVGGRRKGDGEAVLLPVGDA